MLKASMPRAFRVAADGSMTLNTDYFTGAELTNTTINSLDWRGVKLSGATLDDAVLASSKRGRLLDLRGANLAGASLYRARLISVDLRGANLTGADFTDVVV